MAKNSQERLDGSKAGSSQVYRSAKAAFERGDYATSAQLAAIAVEHGAGGADAHALEARAAWRAADYDAAYAAS